MKLVRLQITDLRKLEAVAFELKPAGLNIIAGDNEAGKSTVALAVRSLLEGAGIIPADAVRHGQKSAIVIAETDEGYIFKEKIYPDGTAAIEVTYQDMKKSSPRAFLSEIKGKFFDVRAFSDLPQSEKIAYLKKHIGLDFSDIDANLRDLESERLITGRRKKDLGKKDPVPQVERVEVEALFKERDNLKARQRQEVEAAKQGLIKERDSLKLKQKEQDDKTKQKEKSDNLIKMKTDERAKLLKIIVDAERSIKSLEDDIALEQELNADLGTILSFTQEIDAVEGKLAKVDTFGAYTKEIEELEKKIKESAAINEKARLYQDYLDYTAKAKALDTAYEEMDKKIDALRDEKVKRLREAKLPLEGLEIKEDALVYKGNTSDNWSDSESLEVAAAIGADMAGKLRTIIVRNGEAFGKKKLESFARFCELKDIQCIIEIVEDNPKALTGDNVWFIENGKILNEI